MPFNPADYSQIPIIIKSLENHPEAQTAFLNSLVDQELNFLLKIKPFIADGIQHSTPFHWIVEKCNADTIERVFNKLFDFAPKNNSDQKHDAKDIPGSANFLETLWLLDSETLANNLTSKHFALFMKLINQIKNLHICLRVVANGILSLAKLASTDKLEELYKQIRPDLHNILAYAPYLGSSRIVFSLLAEFLSANTFRDYLKQLSDDVLEKTARHKDSELTGLSYVIAFQPSSFDEYQKRLSDSVINEITLLKKENITLGELSLSAQYLPVELFQTYLKRLSDKTIIQTAMVSFVRIALFGPNKPGIFESYLYQLDDHTTNQVTLHGENCQTDSGIFTPFSYTITQRSFALYLSKLTDKTLNEVVLRDYTYNKVKTKHFQPIAYHLDLANWTLLLNRLSPFTLQSVFKTHDEVIYYNLNQNLKMSSEEKSIATKISKDILSFIEKPEIAIVEHTDAFIHFAASHLKKHKANQNLLHLDQWIPVLEKSLKHCPNNPKVKNQLFALLGRAYLNYHASHLYKSRNEMKTDSKPEQKEQQPKPINRTICLINAYHYLHQITDPKDLDASDNAFVGTSLTEYAARNYDMKNIGNFPHDIAMAFSITNSNNHLSLKLGLECLNAAVNYQRDNKEEAPTYIQNAKTLLCSTLSTEKFDLLAKPDDSKMAMLYDAKIQSLSEASEYLRTKGWNHLSVQIKQFYKQEFKDSEFIYNLSQDKLRCEMEQSPNDRVKIIKNMLHIIQSEKNQTNTPSTMLLFRTLNPYQTWLVAMEKIITEIESEMQKANKVKVHL